MTKLLRTFLALSLFMVAAPLVGHADTLMLQGVGAPCPPGYIGPVDGYCYDGGPQTGIPAAPEVHLSSSVGGIVLLIGGMFVLRGRKAQQN